MEQLTYIAKFICTWSYCYCLTIEGCVGVQLRCAWGRFSSGLHYFLRNHFVGVQLTDFAPRSFVVQMALLRRGSQK